MEYLRVLCCCIAFGLCMAGPAFADEGTSPNKTVTIDLPDIEFLTQGAIDFGGPNRPLTDEFKDLGVIFYGNGGPGSPAYVRPDSDNPTTPVLAGCDVCPYLGPIGAEFVDPLSGLPIAVTSATSNAGVFNSEDGTTFTAYDENSGIVDQVTNGSLGIISMSVSAQSTVFPNLPTLFTRAEFANIGQEAAGFAIDLFSFEACSVSGRVEIPDGTPIPITFVALVTLNPTVLQALTITDVNGWYCFPDAAAGNYLVVAILQFQQIGPFFGFVLDYSVDSSTPQRLDVVLGEVN